jgi:hypothetical protein
MKPCEQCNVPFRPPSGAPGRFCSRRCYGDAKRAGNAGPVPVADPLEVRFRRMVAAGPGFGTDACWMWPGATDIKGYGRIRAAGRMILAHRLSWTLQNGEIPVGMLVCHSCDVPGCVNPAHLFLGTNEDNIVDRMRKGRFTRKRRPYTAAWD